MTLTLGAESAHEVNDETDSQNQSKASTTNQWATQVKPTTTKEQEKNKHQEY